MKTYIIKGIILFLLLSAAQPFFAQSLRSAYFLEATPYRHQLNPAFMGVRNYVAIPVLGNLNIGVQSNIGLSDFIYDYNDPNGKYDYTTFMNSSVSRDEFLGKIHKKNRVDMNLSMPVISFGFHKFNGFNTMEINLRSNTSVNMPYALFDFMKSGLHRAEGSHYQIKDFGIRTNNYVEMALGHSRKITEKLTVGAKVKFLFGMANIEAKFDRMDIYLSQNKWEISANGSLNASFRGGSFKTKDPDAQGRVEVDGLDFDSPGLGGFGLGVDLGATYDLLEGLQLSAAVLDLGFISWSNTLKGQNEGKPFLFEGFRDVAIDSDEDDDPDDLDNQFDDLLDDLEAMVKFYDQGKGGSRTTALAAVLNVGAQYTFPFYKRLTFGLLSSTHINGKYTWSEGRLSANIAPTGWFEASVNYGISNFGSSLGWMFHMHGNGFSFFLGTDHMLTKVNPQFIPINNLNMDVSMGMNITFGKKHLKKS